MPRLIELCEPFLSKRKALGVIPQTEEAKRLAATLNELAEATVLPLEGDLEILLPPTLHAWQRRVCNSSLAEVYTFDDQRVAAFTIRRV